VDEACSARAQQHFDLLDRLPDVAARLAGVKLALQFDEGLIGTIEPPRQDRFVGLVRSRRDYL
jgi:hypothetical protein